MGREFSNAITNRINNCLQQQARGRSVVWRQDNLFDFGGFPTYPKWKGTRGTEKIHVQDDQEAWMDRLLTLAELEWKREAAYECYKRKATQTKEKLDKKLKDKGINEGDLVLRYENRLDNRFDTKFETRWQGLYIVKKAFNSSYYQLMDLNGKEHSRKVNGYRLKHYLSRLLPKDLPKICQKATISCKYCSVKHDNSNQNSKGPNNEDLVKDSEALSLEKMLYDGT
ncbi:hypothetical protein GOP47_0009106 [Adiantum capillus-veneris]|uniref:Uncharacterized protein n=1 Tax=Adiantum capillus-veneris TaxID=13818 RepID=A0A9D4UZJ9_ADICA|nr:hypothetical protein GOP47_0009106 [Adiantum capillus-veneris]